jgi:hypothetical protein
MQYARDNGLFSHVWKSPAVIDLHHCSAAVGRAVMRLLLRDIREGKCGSHDITVVTGRGNRSVGQPVLIGEIQAFLGSVGFRIKKVPTNPGCFILTSDSIQMWLQSDSRALLSNSIGNSDNKENDEYADLSVAALKDLLRKKNAPLGGLKAELIQRLRTT